MMIHIIDNPDPVDSVHIDPVPEPIPIWIHTRNRRMSDNPILSQCSGSRHRFSHSHVPIATNPRQYRQQVCRSYCTLVSIRLTGNFSLSRPIL